MTGLTVYRFANLFHYALPKLILVQMNGFNNPVDVHRAVCYFNIEFECQLELHSRCSPFLFIGER